MPFDPTLPATSANVKAAELRGQFNGLKALIDAVANVTSATVDSVTTLNPGDPATVSVSVIGNVLHVSFGIPRGADGPAGIQGPQGPAFANALVEGVTTLDPGNNATVSAFFDGSNVHFTFAIPRGAQGDQGIQGIQGPAGEVTNAALATALTDTLNSAAANSSANTNAVAPLGILVSDPPTQGELQAVVNKLDELINALRRP